MSDPLAEMMVSFGLDLTDLNSAPSTTSEIFNAMAASAMSASEEISASLTGVSESFAALVEEANTAGVDVGEGLAEGMQVGSEAFTGLEESGGASISDLISVLVDLQGHVRDVAASIDGMSSQVTGAIEDLDSQMTSIGVAAKDSASESEGAFSGFSLTGMVQHIGLTIFGFQNMANMATQLASSLLTPAMNAENMQASFTNLIGSASGASDELSKLDTFAAQTQFTTMDIDQAGAQMLGFGFKASSIIPDIKAVGDNLSAVGKGTPAEVQSVIDIFGKMSTQGKITAMDINQLGAHGITALADIAEGSGKTTKQIQEMIAKGTLPAKDAINDLTKGIEMNPIYAGGMAKQSATLSGIMSTLASDWDVFMAAIMKPALPMLETAMGNLTTLLTNPSFKAFAALVGVDIMNAFQSLGGSITNVTGYLSSLNISGLVTSFKQLDTTLGPIVTDVLNAAGAFGTWFVQSGTLQGIIDGLTTGVGLLRDGVKNVISVGSGLVDFFTKNQAAGDALGAVLLTATGAMIGMAISAIPSLVLSLGATAAGFLGIIGPALAAVAAMAPFLLIGAVVALVITGIILAIQHWGEIAHWLQGIWADVAAFWQADVTIPFQNGLKAVNDGFNGFKTAASNTWNGVVNSVKGGINNIIGGINMFIGFIDSLQIHIPAIGVGPLKTPAFDWNGLGIPKIPTLSTGGVVPPGGVAIAGDPGPSSELVFGGTSGASVLSHAMSVNALQGGGKTEIHNHIYIDGREMSNQLMVQVLSQVRSSGHPIGEAA